MTETRPSRRAVWAGAGLAAAFALAWRYLTFTGFNNDHYVHLSRAYQMLLGEWPVRDFVDPGEPLMYAVSAAARVVAGPALGTEWALVAGAVALAAAGTVVAASALSGSVGIALLVAVLEVLCNPRSFSYPKLLLYAWAAVAMLATAARPRPGRLVVMGATIAVAFLFRHDHGAFIGLGAFVTVVLSGWHEGWKTVTRRVTWLVATAGVLLAPWAIFVALNGGLVAYFQSAVEFTRVEAASTMLRTLPVVAWSAGSDHRESAIAALFYLFYALPISSLVLAGWRRWRGLEAFTGESSVVMGLSLMALPLDFGFLRDSLPGRWPDAAVPAALLGAWLIGRATHARATSVRVIGSAVAAAMVAGVSVAVVVAAETREQLGRTGVLSGWQDVRGRAEDLWVRLGKRLPERDQIPSRYAGSLMPFIAFLDRCTSTQDRLLMTGLFPEMYVLAQRGFAGGQQSFLPGYYSSEAEQQQVVSRLERQSVPFVVMVLSIEPQFRARLARVAEYVDAHYRPMAVIPVTETPGVEVYVDRRRRAASTDAETGWPCFR